VTAFEPAEAEASLWRAFPKEPPDHITQAAFDNDKRHLLRLARLRPREQATAADLWNYSQDLLYTEIQGSLFAYLLPFCLMAWRADLRQIRTGYGGFIEHLYPVLARPCIFENCLGSTQVAAVSKFMQTTILEEIDDQRGLEYQGANSRPYGWVRAFTTYGVLRPDIEQLWREWWALRTVGAAIAAIQYLSCLMYSENENSIFAPWTRERGGGPSLLWGYAGHLYSHRWLQANVDFMETFLHVHRVRDVLATAVDRLAGQPEHARAAQVLEDFPHCISTVEASCAELPRLLATVHDSTLLEWPI
jgi:hypothetical protein